MAKSDIQLDAEFKWNYKHSVIIQRKGFGKELNKYFADLVADYSDEFVPYAEGDLSHYVQTFGAKNHGTVTYQMPYAGPQYTGENGSGVPEVNWERKKNPHPLATSYWDKACWATYGDEITKEVNRKRKELSV